MESLELLPEIVPSLRLVQDLPISVDMFHDLTGSCSEELVLKVLSEAMAPQRIWVVWFYIDAGSHSSERLFEMLRKCHVYEYVYIIYCTETLQGKEARDMLSKTSDNF